MPDREKVIKELNTDVLPFLQHHCDMQCDREKRWISKMIITVHDIIALLKEQEAEKPKGHWMPYEPDKRGYTDGFKCSRCERVILSDHYCKMIDFDFCPYCGAYMDNAEGR